MTDNIEARLRRIETALVLLCQHLGLNPRTGERIAADIHQPLEFPVRSRKERDD